MLKLALAPALPPDKDIPRILFYEELDHMDKTSWLGFETALVATDRCSLQMAWLQINRTWIAFHWMGSKM